LAFQNQKVIAVIFTMGKAMILEETVEKPQVKSMIMKIRPSKH
jgi:hypothetical protein